MSDTPWIRERKGGMKKQKEGSNRKNKKIKKQEQGKIVQKIK